MEAACNEKIAQKITSKGGDYLLALKKNQKQLYQQVSGWLFKHKEYLPKDEWVDFGSSRIEKRTCYLLEDLTLLDDLSAWPGIKRGVMMEASQEKEGKIEQETRFYLSSLAADATTFNQAVRNYWGIENKLHWMLDVVFGQDQNRTRKDNAPENFT